MESKWDLVGVVTQPDRRRGRGRKLGSPPVKEFVEGKGLPVFQPEGAQELTQHLSTLDQKPDVIVVVAYGMFLPEPVLDYPPLGCINLHPSLLPAYRGAAPIQRAVMNGEVTTGITTMYLSQEMDAGDIILQEEFLIAEDATTGDMAAILSEAGAALMLKTLELLNEGRAPHRVQEHQIATYAPPICKEEERIEWQRDARGIYNQIRGMNPKPGAYTVHEGKNLKVWSSKLVEGDMPGCEPGVVVELDKKAGPIIQTGSGRLLLTEVQPAGRKRMSGAEFLRGYRISPGMYLG